MNRTANRPYVAGDLAILVPTKDRPRKIHSLLNSIAAQPEMPGRILILDGGQSVRESVLSYGDRLKIEHYVCQPPGQIRQRNLGISLLDERTPLIACFDDDIVLAPNAIEAMIEFWNRCEGGPAGVGFNIVNTAPEPRNFVRDLFLMSGPEPGRVLCSGATTSNCQVKSDIRCQWLCGGATVWRIEILKRYPHREIPGRWAIGEDLIFSYPIGQRHPLYVCAGAQVRHEHVFDYTSSRPPHRFHGLTRTLWMFYFEEANADLSRLAFLWMIFGSIAGRILAGLFTLNRSHLDFAWGQIEGVVKGISAIISEGDVVKAIERECK